MNAVAVGIEHLFANSIIIRPGAVRNLELDEQRTGIDLLILIYNRVNEVL
jgi:hypothetical protein